MSQENVDRLRVAYERFGTDGLTMDLLTDDVEFRQPDEIDGGEGVYHGRHGVVRGVQQLLDVFDELRAEPEEFFVAGGLRRCVRAATRSREGQRRADRRASGPCLEISGRTGGPLARDFDR